MAGLPSPQRRIAELVLTRGVPLVYLAALLSLHIQARGLFGEQGILPLRTSLQLFQFQGDSPLSRPSLFWFSTTPWFLEAVFATGYVAAACAVAGLFPGPSYLVMWLVYLSFVNSVQHFLAYQWDNLLCESCFWLGVILPWRPKQPVDGKGSSFGYWVIVLLVFKLMFQSGLVKVLSGDPTWRNLTAMQYHYMTQPLPNPLSWYAFHLPPTWHRLETLAALVIELILPPLVFFGHTARLSAGVGFCVLQLCILLTGNYGFFNVLTLVLCASLWCVPTPRALAAAVRSDPKGAAAATLYILTMLVQLHAISTRHLSRPERIVWWLGTRYRVSTPYGLFAVMTTQRPELILEVSSDGNRWQEVTFRHKPGPLDRRPPALLLHMPRLDWQMWFAALGPQAEPWLPRFLNLLVEAKPAAVLDLLDPSGRDTLRRAQYARLVLYDYRFTSWQEGHASGRWWTRERIAVVVEVSGRSSRQAQSSSPHLIEDLRSDLRAGVAAAPAGGVHSNDPPSPAAVAPNRTATLSEVGVSEMTDEPTAHRDYPSGAPVLTLPPFLERIRGQINRVAAQVQQSGAELACAQHRQPEPTGRFAHRTVELDDGHVCASTVMTLPLAGYPNGSSTMCSKGQLSPTPPWADENLGRKTAETAVEHAVGCRQRQHRMD